ncbi:MAG: dephospho-CoA kinase [Thiomargarita sp.]|nr:dephospho-CoA kinase [Thiomargarita sp.]
MDLPLKIGLTGGIATGKSTVSKQFAKLGVPIIDADEIAHALVEPGEPALRLIIQTYGSKMLQSDGRLNRAKLRDKIFADEQERKRLEAILHPRIRQVIQEQVAQVQEPICLLSIPLLLETQHKYKVDRILVVDCSPDLQRKRLLTRDISLVQIEQILKAQTNRTARLAKADDVIYNDSDFDNLQQQIDALYQKYADEIQLVRNHVL